MGIRLPNLKRRTAVKRNYHTIEKQGKVNARKLGEFLSKSGQLLLPMVDLIEQCQMACDELIDVAGRATIQAVLELSAQQVAGPRLSSPICTTRQKTEIVGHIRNGQS